MQMISSGKSISEKVILLKIQNIGELMTQGMLSILHI